MLGRRGKYHDAKSFATMIIVSDEVDNTNDARSMGIDLLSGAIGLRNDEDKLFIWTGRIQACMISPCIELVGRESMLLST